MKFYGLSAWCVFAATAAAVDVPQKGDLDAFINAQATAALQGVLANIGSSTQNSGVGNGIVIASPSREKPDYFFTWTRDAALTMIMIMEEIEFGNTNLLPYVDAYLHSQAVIQTQKNPSGRLLPAGLGLGEAKFNVDGSAFNGAWGRPQRDGPALRAIALIKYANYLIGQGHQATVLEMVWPVISNDLNYVGSYWNSTGFDLWEEVKGSSFFTTQSQYYSLVEGAELAKKLGLQCNSCDQAPAILCFLQSYWNGKYVSGNINLERVSRSGIDANPMLAANLVFDRSASCHSPTLQPCHSQSLANFKVFVDTFRNATLYPINLERKSNEGIALGRYPEDTYENGNPWYLVTLGAAEFLYHVAEQWNTQGELTIDDTSLAFFQTIDPAVTSTHTIKKTDPLFPGLLAAVRAYADSFVSLVQTYSTPNGALSEQFLKSPPGSQASARDLTWSYASFITMARRRSGKFPVSGWNALISTLPNRCVASSQAGVYAPAIAAGAPNVVAPQCSSTVRFLLNATTFYGENIFVTGNVSEIGLWKLDNGAPLSASNYTQEWPLWYAEVEFDPGQVISYKYIRERPCKNPLVLEEANRTVVVPPCNGNAGQTVTSTDAWIGAVPAC